MCFIQQNKIIHLLIQPDPAITPGCMLMLKFSPRFHPSAALSNLCFKHSWLDSFLFFFLKQKIFFFQPGSR